MVRFASRELAFVSLADESRAAITGNTQQCGDNGVDDEHCTCCTDETGNKTKLAFDEDLPALRDQLHAACV